jgi:protein O-GlcNAc transferase
LTSETSRQTPAQRCFREGRELRRHGDLPAAIARFEETLRLQPDFIPAYNNLANLLQAQGRNDDAAALYEKALTLAPGKAVLHCNLASLRQVQGQPDQARTGFARAIALDPDFFLAHYNLGKLLAAQGQLALAIAAYQQALRLQPEAGEVQLDLGDVYRQLDQLEPTIASYKAAVRALPKSARAYNSLGAILQQHGEVKYALACHRRALKLDPDLAVAHFNIAMMLEGSGDLVQARTHFERSLALQPEAPHVLCHLNYVLLKLADWHGYDQRVAQLAAQMQAYLERDRAMSLPLFSLLAFPLPAALLADVTRHVAREHVRAAMLMQADLPAADTVSAPQRLRIGYVSPDFRFHAMGTLISELFQHHSRPEFEIFAYSLAPIEDAWTKQVRLGCDHYTDVSGESTLVTARRIRADGIHILIDLAGYTSNARTALFALQPAPVQALYLGFPGTMGAEFIQHILADRVLIPPESAAHFSEQVTYLPHAWVASPMRIAASGLTRADCGLPATGMVFCCFNGIYKIEPRVFEVWMRILKRVTGSVLWLSKGAQPVVTENLRRQAAALDVDPTRLVFAGVLPHDQYLARYRLADLFLDTFAYNAGATAVGALWAGLPVLTCPGSSYASRMGASVCHAMGMPELICDSLADYEEQAVALGSDDGQLQALKARVAQAQDDAPLFQPLAFVRALEGALQDMWRDHARACGAS